MKRICIAFVLLLIGSSLAFAAIPEELNYQGVLTDAGGSAVTDGTYQLVFRLYDVAAGGSALWQETHASVQVTKGIFEVILGSTTPIDLDFYSQYYLGISVEGEAELSPRVKLTSAAYSFLSKGTRGQDNIFPSSGSVGIGVMTPFYPLTINGPADKQVGISYNGYNSQYASIYVNAAVGTARPAIGYCRGALEAMTLYDTDDRYKIRVDGINHVAVTPTGEVGIGDMNPAEKLEVAGAVRIGTTANTNAGTIRWTGSDFEGYDGGGWQSLTGGGSGSLPSGTSGQTLRHSGSDWVATSNLYNDGTDIGIGTDSPSCALHVYRDADAMVSIRLENPNTGASSTQRIDFADENGTVAGLAIFDDDMVSYPSEMRLFNNRPNGALELLAGSGSVQIQNDGDVGIGVGNPNATLHVKGGNWDLDGTNGDIKIGDDAYRLKIGVATDGGGAGTAGIRMQGGLGRLVLGGGSSEVVMIESNGDVSLGSDAQTSALYLYREGLASNVAGIFTHNSGGRIYAYDEAGNPLVAAEPDFNGTGGWFGVTRAPGLYGFTVEGNYAGLEEPRVTISGSSSSASFRMDQTEDASVVLPVSSINSGEILNEPGLAANTMYDTGGIALTGTDFDAIASRTITVPASGFVLVIASAQVDFTHTTGSVSYANFGVSSVDNLLPVAQDVQENVPGSLPTDTYRIGVTRHNVFSVAGPGAYTFYFIGREYAGEASAFDVQLTLVYLPTPYGLVTLAGTAGSEDERPARGPLTSAEIAAERSESERVDMDRMQRELDAMRAELEEIKQELGNRP